MHETDDLIHRCRQGDALAWEALIRRFQGRVYGTAYFFMQNGDDAQDVMQEVFIKVYRQLDSYHGREAAFVTWLLAITRNCCLDRLRRQDTRGKLQNELRHTRPHTAASTENPESRLSQSEDRDLLYAALEQFSDTNRDIILLKEIQGLKNEEVAEILSLPVGTVKSRANRARVKLARVLGEMMNGSEASTEPGV